MLLYLPVYVVLNMNACLHRDLSHSRSASFPEKKDYNPLINIEYVDDKGRALTPKEVRLYMHTYMYNVHVHTSVSAIACILMYMCVCVYM